MATPFLLQRVDHLLGFRVNIQRLELGKGPLEPKERQHGRAVGFNLEAARARFKRALFIHLRQEGIVVDENLRALDSRLHGRLDLGGPSLECASRLACFDGDERCRGRGFGRRTLGGRLGLVGGGRGAGAGGCLALGHGARTLRRSVRMWAHVVDHMQLLAYVRALLIIGSYQ